jgi:2-hydroxy-3-oxopropionate reductase
MKIGMVGLGIMGKPMAKNLVKTGYDLTVFDYKQSVIDELVAAGAKCAADSKEISATCDVILTMLPNSPDVKAVMLGKGGMVENIREGTVFIDMSSIDPIASQEIAAELAKKGVRMLDAPVSGGEPGAIAGTLSFMVGGDEDLFNEYKPLLETMGSSVVRCGSIGAGNTTKLANQVIVAVNIAAVSEAFMLVEKAGVDPHLVFDAIKGGLAGSNVMNAKANMIMDGNYRPGFKIDLHIKDLNNALSTGHSVGAPLPMTSSAMEILQNVKADGLGQNDHSAMAKFYEKLTGTKIGRE